MALNYLDKAAWDAGVYKDKSNDDDTQQDTSSEDSGYSASGILSAAKNFLEHPFQGMGTVIAPNYTPRPLDDSVYSDIPGTPVASGQFGELEDESVRDERMKDSADYMAANWPRLYGGVVAADEGLANVVGGIQNAVGGGNGILTNVQRAEEGMQNYRDQWNNEYGDSYFLNPNKFATDAGSVIGSSVPIMALSALMPGAAVAGGTRALTSALSRAGLGRLAMSKAGQALIADTVRSIPTSNLADSLSEYGTVVNDMMQDGMSEDEARRRAIPMFFKNMALDTFTVPLELGVMKGGKGIATSLLGRSAGEGMAKSIAKGAARTGMLAGASGLTEGYQEGAQNALENDVQGKRDGGWYNPFTWTNEDWEAARGGFVGGALMGVPGNVAAGFHPEARQAPLSAESQEQAQSIKDTLSHGKPAGMSNAAYNAYIELANSGNPDLIKQAASSLESFQQSQEGSQESTDDAATEAYKDYETYDQKQEIENFLNNNTVEQIGGEGNFNWLMGVLRNGTPEEVQHAYDTVVAAEKATAEQEAKNRPARSGGSMAENTGNAMVNIVIQAANDSGVDPRLGLAIAARESGGDDVNAISMPPPHDGVYGVMQAQEETVSNMGLDSQYPDWKTDPYQNAMVGMAILKAKIDGENGDVWAGVRDYNGAGEEAEQYRQLVKNNYDNMGDIGGGGSGNVEAPSEAFYDLSEAMNPQVDGMDPNTMAKMNLLARDFYQKYGHRLLVTSLKRNGDGSSYHDEGHAFDFSDDFLEQNPDARDWLVQQGEKYGLKGLDEFSHPVATTDGGNVHFTDHGGPVPGGASSGVSSKVAGDNGQFERELDQAAQEAKSDMDKIQAQSDQAMNEIMNDDSAEKTAQDAQQDAENAQKQAEESHQSAQDDVVPDVAQTIRDTSNNIDEINTLDGMFTKDSNGNDKFIDTPENRDFIKTNYKDEIAKAVNDAMSKKKAPSATPVPKAQQQTPHARLGRILSTYDRKDPKFKEYMNTFRNGTEQEQKKLADDLQTTQELERANSLKGNPLTTQQDQNVPQNAPQQAVETPEQPEQVNTPVQAKESLETQKKRKIYLAKKQKLMERVPAGKTVKVHASTNDAGFDATYKIVPAGDITASHNTNYAVNDLYPAEYQPRDRNRPQMRVQVEKMTKGMKPELLAESQFVNEGAPVVNNSGVVLNGNGRVMAVQKAYKGLTDAHKKSAKAYKDYLVSIAPSLGIAPEKVQSMAHPVLVRQAADDADTNAIINSTEPAGSGRVHQQEAGRVQSQEKEGNEVDEKSKQSDHVDTEPQQTESKDKESTHAEEGSQGDVQEEVSKFHNVLDDEKSTPKQVIDAYKSVVDKVIASANGSRKNAKIGDKIVTDEYQYLTNSKHWGAFMNEDGGRNWHEVATINADAHKILRVIIKTAGKETAPKAEQSKETKPAEQPKEKAGFTDDEIKTLTDRGFNRWTKKLSNGKVMDRLYINPEYLGLELTRYKSGNISSAKFNGESISNSEARRIEGTKCYVDVATKEVVCDRDDLKQAAQEVVDDALSKEKSQVLAQAETKKAAPKDDVVVTGDEFGEYKDLKELRVKAKAYYKEHLQGTSVHNPILGTIKLESDRVDFTRSGMGKMVATSAKEHKLLLVSHLKELIENADSVTTNGNIKDKRNASSYSYLHSTAIIDGKKQNVTITIFTDVNGNKYYNHTLPDEEGTNKKEALSVPPAQATKNSNGIPAIDRVSSTSIIPPKAEKGNNVDELRNKLSDGGKQAYDYALDKLSKGNEKVAQSAKESAFIYARMAERWSEIMHEYGNKTYSPEDYTKSHPIVISKQTGDAQLEQVFEQRAWHGSSHDFDKFDLGYIGTGEGAQAHGWGLYFAGNKDISQGYANKLSNPVGEVKVAGIIYSIGRGGGSWRVRNIATGELISKMKIVKAISALYTEQGKDKALKYLKDKADQTRKFKKIWIDAYNWLKNQEVDDSQWHNGKLYEVEIPDIGTLLDEQKSLSEQPSKVKKAILDYYRSRPDEYIAPKDETLTGNNMTGKEFLKDVIFQLRREGSNTPERDASLLLNSFGINGITYYGNRDGRCYVVFDDKAIQIIDKYNQDVHNAKAAYDTSTGAIRLFDIADQSSFIHESAHMFLSDMERLAQKKDAPAGLISDLQTVKDWAGYKPGQMKGYKGTALEKEFQEYADAIREAKKAGDAVAIKSAEARWIHERFARGFERYIADGKAPNESLKKVFEKFKDWMVSIYQDLKNLGKKPPKEIQDVMARMITPEVDTKYSVREANGQLTRSKEDLKAEIKEAFPNAKAIKDEGDRMTFTMPNGSHIVVDVKNEILLTDEELAQAKKDHHIDDNGNVVVEGYAQLHGKDAYMALSQGSRENTGFHEAYHLAEGAVLTDREKAAIKKAIPDAEKRADKYAEWVEARKHGRGTAWGKLFQKIKNFAARMREIFTGVETVNDIFRQIESGRVWEREVNEQNTNNINGEKYYSIRKQDEKISRDAKKKLMKHVEIAQKKADEKDIGVHRTFLQSPSRIAEKKKYFRPFFRMADDAMNLLTKLRADYQRHLDSALNLSKKDKASLQELLWAGDMEGKEYTREELREQGYDEKVIDSYWQIRNLFRKAYNQLNETRKQAKTKTGHFSGRKLDELRHNKFVEILRETEQDDGSTLVSYKEYGNWQSHYLVNEDELKALENDDNIQILEKIPTTEGPMDGQKHWKVTTREGAPDIHDRKGYVPHFFHEYMVRFVDSHGKATVISSGRTIREATKNAIKWQAENEEMLKKRNEGDWKITIAPKVFDFGEIGLDESQYATTVGDKDFYRMEKKIADKHSLTLHEAKEMLDGMVKKKGRHRFFGNFLRRTGADGYEQEIEWVLRHYFNSTSRYVAMESKFKPQAISLFERLFGRFDNEYHGLPNYIKEYINDINGNPSTLEKQLNDLLNAIPAIGKWVNAHVGDRAAVSLANSITNKISIAKLGFLNVSSAMLNILQIANAAAYTGNISTLWKALLKGAHRKYSLHDLKILRETNVLNDIGLDSGAGYGKFSAGKWANRGMILFKESEGIVRRGVTLAAYEAGRKRGMSHEEAIRYAKDVNRKSNFDYGVHDAPGIFRRGSIFSQIFLQFKKYPIKQLEAMKDFLPFFGKGTTKKQKAIFWGTYFAMAGLFQIPFANILGLLIMGITGDDPEKEAKKSLIELAENYPSLKPLAKIGMYGIGTFANIDITSRVGIGDAVPDDLQSIFGPAASTLFNVAKSAYGGDNWTKQVRNISPGLGNLLMAAQGNSVGKRGRVTQEYTTPYQRLLRGMGFQSTDESDSYLIQSILSSEKKKASSKKQQLIDEYIANPTGENARKLKSAGIKPSTVKAEQKKKQLDTQGRTEISMNKNDKKQYKYLLDW